jgi:hypothetical protein
MSPSPTSHLEDRETTRTSVTDPLAPARGFVLGVLPCVAGWVIVGLVILVLL